MGTIPGLTNPASTVLLAAEDIHSPWNGHDTLVLVMTVVGIAIIVLLIVLLKMHAFLALTIGALFVGGGPHLDAQLREALDAVLKEGGVAQPAPR